MAGGVKGASVGKPNLDEMGPSQYWPITLEVLSPVASGRCDGDHERILPPSTGQRC